MDREEHTGLLQSVVSCPVAPWQVVACAIVVEDSFGGQGTLLLVCLNLLPAALWPRGTEFIAMLAALLTLTVNVAVNRARRDASCHGGP